MQSKLENVLFEDTGESLKGLSGNRVERVDGALDTRISEWSPHVLHSPLSEASGTGPALIWVDEYLRPCRGLLWMSDCPASRSV